MKGLRWIAAIGLMLFAAEGRAIDLPASSSAAEIVYAPPQYEPAPPSPVVGIKANGRRVKRGKPAQIVVWVSPCKEQRGKVVRLLRDGRPNGNRFVSRGCTARFYPRVRRPTVFQAELAREEDGAFFTASRWLKIKINRRR